MNRIAIVVALTLGSAVAASGMSHAGSAIEDARAGCAVELKAYCKNVTPGEGRLLNCMRTHFDKLSKKCIFAVNRGLFRIKRAETVIQYIIFQCRADALKSCGDVKVGGGRALKCLSKNRKNLQKNCELALKDIGVLK